MTIKDSYAHATHAVVDRLMTVTDVRMDGSVVSQTHWFDGHQISGPELEAIFESVSAEQWLRLDHPIEFYQL